MSVLRGATSRIVLGLAIPIATLGLVREIPRGHVQDAGAATLAHGGFSFMKGDCSIDQSNCALRNPKEWTPRDVALVRKAIDEITATARGADILHRAQSRGVTAGTRSTFVLHTPEDVAIMTEFNRKFAALEKRGDWASQGRLDRMMALRMRPIRVPSMLSIRMPREALAEIGAHLVLDPKARHYLPADLIAYYETNVFATRGVK